MIQRASSNEVHKYLALKGIELRLSTHAYSFTFPNGTTIDLSYKIWDTSKSTESTNWEILEVLKRTEDKWQRL